MSGLNLFYSLLLTAATTVSAIIVLVVWRRRSATNASTALFAFALGLVLWDLTYALHWANTPRPSAFFWLDLTFLGVVIVPTAFLAFALSFTNRAHWLNRRNAVLFAVEPALTLCLLWTDPWHGLFFGGARAPVAVIREGGFWFWLNVLYSYGLILIAFIVLIQAFVRAPRLYRGQVGMILLGAFVPWVSNALTLLNITPLPDLDLTPFAFTLTGIAFAASLFHYRLLDIVPVARHALIEIMNDGMLVLDAKDRIVDINPAARKLFGVHAVSPIGQHVELLLGMWPEILACWREDQECHNDLEVAGRYFDLHATPLRDHNDRFSGRLIVFRDITSHKQHMLEIQALQKELREQAIRDALTGLFNRRYLEETLERELARARRESTTVSVIMMDIDFFKWFNDTLGHKAGDVMLRALGEMLKTQTRTGDVACRFGGEEFAVVLPGAPLTIAQQRAEQLRAAFEHMRVRYEDMELHATLSAGVAAFPTHGASGDVVLNAADQALYVAKRSGRNRVAVWQGWTEEVGT